MKSLVAEDFVSKIVVVFPTYVDCTIFTHSSAPSSFSRLLKGRTLTATFTLIFITPKKKRLKWVNEDELKVSQSVSKTGGK